MEKEYLLGAILKKRREDLNIGVRELCRKINKNVIAGQHLVSPSYYSQVENAAGIRPEKTSMDFFWAVATALDLDPMELFLASRPNIPKDLANAYLKRLKR
jgi:transcriptional regulator with XRE-family HTH domain